jgi:hypothetical protein
MNAMNQIDFYRNTTVSFNVINIDIHIMFIALYDIHVIRILIHLGLH